VGKGRRINIGSFFDASGLEPRSSAMDALACGQIVWYG
jgi:hypothetical protein